MIQPSLQVSEEHFALVFRLLRLEHYDMVSRLQLLNEIDYLLVLHPSATSETTLELSVMTRQLLRALTMQENILADFHVLHESHPAADVHVALVRDFAWRLVRSSLVYDRSRGRNLYGVREIQEQSFQRCHVHGFRSAT